MSNIIIFFMVGLAVAFITHLIIRVYQTHNELEEVEIRLEIAQDKLEDKDKLLLEGTKTIIDQQLTISSQADEIVKQYVIITELLDKVKK